MHSIILCLHIAAGFSALFSGCAAILAPKGKKVHVTSGRIYFWSMIIVALSAVILSVVRPQPFLLLVSLFSLFLTWSGFKAIRWKNKPLTGLAYTFNKTLIPLFLLAGGMMVMLAFSGWIGLPVSENLEQLNILLFIFGALFTGLSVGEWKQMNQPRLKGRYWWIYRHISGMMGAYIATFTAFLVVNNTFLPELAAWLGPTFIGSPMISWWIRKYRRKVSTNQVSTE